MRTSAKLVLGRVAMYGLLAALIVGLIHVYVVYPLYIKKIPYFTEALLARGKVQCSGLASDRLAGFLKNASLPYFSLQGSVTLISGGGKISDCRIGAHGDLGRGELFRFASMTKVLTAFAVLELSKGKSLNLDSRLIDFFPELDSTRVSDPNVLEISLNNLLDHASGLGGPFGSDNMVDKKERPWCPYNPQALEIVRLAGKPGTNHLYSNVSYCLLGEVMARVSGVPYKEYMQQHYLTDYPSLEFAEGDFLPGEPSYDFSNDYRFDETYVTWLDFQALAPAAGLMGDPAEFAELVWSLYRKHPEILQRENVKACLASKAKRCYSRTFVIHESDSGQRIGIQQGYLPGASSLVAINSVGDVLVWTAAGAPLESRYRNLMEEKVVSFLFERVAS